MRVFYVNRLSSYGPCMHRGAVSHILYRKVGREMKESKTAVGKFKSKLPQHVACTVNATRQAHTLD